MYIKPITFSIHRQSERLHSLYQKILHISILKYKTNLLLFSFFSPDSLGISKKERGFFCRGHAPKIIHHTSLLPYGYHHDKDGAAASNPNTLFPFDTYHLVKRFKQRLYLPTNQLIELKRHDFSFYEFLFRISFLSRYILVPKRFEYIVHLQTALLSYGEFYTGKHR